ncbi:hypothetical protein [Humibacter antri]
MAAQRGPPPSRCVNERSILVLDVVCILGIAALGAVVALVGRAVEKL